MNFVMIGCPVCDYPLPFNPQHPRGTMEEPDKEPQLRCPVDACSGWVCKVEDFWGCGECGEVWRDRKSLNRAISATVKKHPYRAGCYVKKGSGWTPADQAQERSDYEELVESEWNEKPAGKSVKKKTVTKTARRGTSKSPKKKRK